MQLDTVVEEREDTRPDGGRVSLEWFVARYPHLVAYAARAYRAGVLSLRICADLLGRVAGVRPSHETVRLWFRPNGLVDSYRDALASVGESLDEPVPMQRTDVSRGIGFSSVSYATPTAQAWRGNRRRYNRFWSFISQDPIFILHAVELYRAGEISHRMMMHLFRSRGWEIHYRESYRWFKRGGTFDAHINDVRFLIANNIRLYPESSEADHESEHTPERAQGHSA